MYKVELLAENVLIMHLLSVKECPFSVEIIPFYFG